MNRFVSLLLVALCLAAVTLAQPAQAQQWVRGLPYFLSGNTQSSQPGTTITAVINGGNTGHLNITATPTNSDPGYTTGGTYNGSVGVYYVWSGSNPTQAGTVTATQSYEVTGTGNGNSTAGSLYGYHSYYNTGPGWDTTESVPFSHHFDAGVSPPSWNPTASIAGTTSAQYNSAYPLANMIVTADVTFGAPVTTYP